MAITDKKKIITRITDNKSNPYLQLLSEEVKTQQMLSAG